MRSSCLTLLVIDVAALCWTTTGYEEGPGRIYAIDASWGSLVVARRNFLELYDVVEDDAGIPKKKLISRAEWDEGTFFEDPAALLDFKLVTHTLLYFCSTSLCA